MSIPMESGILMSAVNLIHVLDSGGIYRMKLGVFSVLFAQKPFEEALDYIASKGLDAIEIGKTDFRLFLGARTHAQNSGVALSFEQHAGQSILSRCA